MQNGYCGLTLKPLQALALEQSEILQIISVTTNERIKTTPPPQLKNI